jgi:hypothetical protein
MLTQRRLLLAAIASFAVLGSALAAHATSLEVTATPFKGSDTAVDVVLTEEGGDIVFTLNVTKGIGDIRGVFFDVADDSLLDGLHATGEFVTKLETGGVISLGHGNNLRGDGSPCPCDVGVALGTPGIGKDDIQSTSFVLSHDDVALTLDQFTEQLIGIRVTSVGNLDDDKDKDKHEHWGHSGWDRDSWDKGGWSKGGWSKDGKDDKDKKSDGDGGKDGWKHSDYARHWKHKLDCKDDPGDGRNGSAKLVGRFPELVPVPEPSTALILAFGLGAIGYARRPRR